MRRLFVGQFARRNDFRTTRYSYCIYHHRCVYSDSGCLYESYGVYGIPIPELPASYIECEFRRIGRKGTFISAKG